jgi:hypothetical protein
MSKRLFTTQGLTFTASAAGSALSAGSISMALKGGAATQLIDVLEVLISGLATASTVAAMALARASTLETTPTALAAPHSDAAVFPNATALSSTVVPFITAGTQATPSNTVTDAKLNLALNLFGGIVRWNAAPTQQWQIIGSVAPGGESVLWNSLTGGGSSGLPNAHILYEPY